MNKIIFKSLLNLFIVISLLGAVNNDIMEKINAEVGIASINEKGDNIIIDIYSINQVPIAGVQFEIEPNDLFKIDSISGGICSEIGFSLYSNEKGVLLGFSLQANEIPKSANHNINDNILFSAYGKKIKKLENQRITLKTTLAGKKGNKINVKVNEYVYKTIEDNNLQSK